MEESKFCAFIDILGFKNKIAENFEEAKHFYQNFMTKLKLSDDVLLEMREIDSLTISKRSDVEFAIFSDSAIIYGKDLKDFLFRLSNITSWLNSYGYFFRGGIGYGKHFSEISPNNYLIVSEGLVQAATIESQLAIYPRIVISESAMNAILSNNDINYYFLSHHFIQDNNNLWFINPFFLNPDISNIYYIVKENITKYKGTDIQNKFLWLRDLCEYFNMKYQIRVSPHQYYFRQSTQQDNLNLFFYPAIFSQMRFGDKFNYTINLNIYKNTFDENIKDILSQHNYLSQQPNILDELRKESRIKAD